MPSFLRRRSTWGFIILGLVLLAGIGAFVLAFQPCRFAVAPGRALRWTLSTATADILPDGSLGTARTADFQLALVGIGPGYGDAALVAGLVGGAPSQVSLLQVGSDGACRQVLADGRIDDAGAVVAGFDLSLLPLPPGAEQEWKPNVVWAALPADRRSVGCTAKRQRSGARPEFRCEFPASIEWVDAATGRYRQVRGMTSLWKFDSLRGVPLSATVHYRIYEELPAPAQRRGRDVVLELRWDGSSDAGDPARLRTAARAAAAASGYVQARRMPPAALLSDVRAGGGPFSGLADGLLARLGGR